MSWLLGHGACRCDRPIAVAHSETCVKCGRAVQTLTPAPSSQRIAEGIVLAADGHRRVGDGAKGKPQRPAKYG